ncbi:DUF2591 domain-containing protein [Burkholderia stagnalis]|uniref:2-oxoglutarate dehydrogenase n=1 Tax=Burkholderia stagnalis TaxID=1503054 RepID=A0A107ZN79_9BURK|nr:phage protein NinX family protein [Burkholderia stagnalis]AOK54949.1 2-oxoglutarate dehydrogenase [Burkholderia stagnalis]KVN02620.1 2-oxoglutarate dehydrogenase [Burkholderia stagnalis]KVN27125.1 2-oxoglutarate dehydrogenase [Burkholderia stagnalis]KVN59022.1 2-oxoglutarate dehydrogenase [Burkholderia stagnalis]KVN80231.1 2-oxoglutarate dehydrogenase [Burkholderia stagnalis]
MRIDVLDGAGLDYWCARALCADGDALRFTAVVPGVVVTAASDGLRRLDAHFAPTASWADAGSVLERVDDVRIVRYDAGAACVARFTGLSGTFAAHGATPRIALLRAFVRARFGDDVDAPPDFPHAVERGAIVRYAPGAPIPESGAVSAAGDSTDIRSVPRM